MVRDELLGGRYRLVRRLGEGGMGEVWEAHDETLDRPVAVKVISLLSGRGSRGTESRARFLREAKLTARLQHPHIVTLHDLGETASDAGRAPFLVMELVRGRGMDEILREGAVGVAEAAGWGVQICGALAEAHDAGILHRDIKPSNILVTAARTAKVLDFGVARAADPYAAADRLTQTGFIVGTPAYMPPEQARGHAEPRSDLYALGCLLFELTTGELPFKAPDTVGYLTAHLTQPPPAPSSLVPGLPTAWDDLLLALLSKDPGDRPSTAAELASRLRRFERIHATSTRPRTPAAPPTAPPTTARTTTPVAGPSGPAPRILHGAEPLPGSAVAAVVFALLGVPGVAYVFTRAIGFVDDEGAPRGVIMGNLVATAVAGVGLLLGSWLLARRRPAGRRTIVVAGTLAALQGFSIGVQVALTGGDAGSEDTHAFLVVGLLTGCAAAGAMIAAALPRTRRWLASATR
ncbi:serine/threonine-protein kinase [Yinghuangia sp. YIM S09857]|uniref:serine/threonine-protein kinase n=1 Tax=Yinghuangia sp. YIM S09857 TaxID=3436929 RepID=UPI003F53E32E